MPTYAERYQAVSWDGSMHVTTPSVELLEQWAGVGGCRNTGIRKTNPSHEKFKLSRATEARIILAAN
jgi:hypothetical protein